MKARALICGAIIACASLAGSTAAQVTVENSISTDSVDLFPEQEADGKSASIAMGASLLLPGLGHEYLEKKTSALAYFTAEAAALFAAVFCNSVSHKKLLDASGYAFLRAGAGGPAARDLDNTYWQAVGRFMDVQEYNTVMDLNRTPDEKITDPSRTWHWDDKSSQDEYNRIRASARSFQVASSFFIGAIVLNRVVAFIDVRSSSRSAGTKRTGTLSSAVVPAFYASPRSIGLSVAGNF